MEKDFDPIASVFDSAAALSELADGLESDRHASPDCFSAPAGG